jgi:hypothetical protein
MRTLLLAGILCTGTGLAEYSASLHVLSTTSLSAQKSKALIDEMIEAMGGAEALYALGDVSYVYHNARGASEERYIFDGEISWGRSKTSGGLTRVQFLTGNPPGFGLMVRRRRRNLRSNRPSFPGKPITTGCS